VAGGSGGSMTTSHEREQEERRAYLENEKLLREKAADDRRASTYLAQAQAAAEDIGGRFKQVSPMTITGATPIPQVPMQPEGSPWSQQWPEGPDEFGVPIDAMEPVGSEAEIERAAEILREQADPTAAPSLAVDCADVVSAPVVATLATVEPIATSAPQSKSPQTVGGAASVVGEAGNSSAANDAVPRSFNRRI
jgi:hypothetical protein